MRSTNVRLRALLRPKIGRIMLKADEAYDIAKKSESKFAKTEQVELELAEIEQKIIERSKQGFTDILVAVLSQPAYAELMRLGYSVKSSRILNNTKTGVQISWG